MTPTPVSNGHASQTGGGVTSRVAWVTGGGTGIGRALADALYREGYQVAISGRRPEVLLKTADEISSTPGAGEVFAVSADVSVAAEVTQAIQAIQAKWGDVDLVINNAGENPYHSFQEASPDEFVQIFKANCLSAVLCTKAVLPGMIKRHSGAVVNISSVLGLWASPTSTAYSVSKYALAGLTDSLRQEFEGSGIHFMGVYPGYITTQMTAPFVTPGSPRSRVGKSPEAMAEAILKGLQRKQSEVLYPWYVPLAVRLHQWFPATLEKLRSRFGR